jgi:hypothetical protein
MPPRFRLTLALLTCLFPLSPCLAADSFQELLTKVPENANAIILIDVQALQKCPLGVRENWAKKHESQYLGGATHIPPTAARAVLAAQLNPSTLRNDWQLGLVQLQQDVSMPKLAGSQGGDVEMLSGKPVVLVSQNAFAVQLTPQTVGVMGPANRQGLARWITYANRNTKVLLSPYLKEAVMEATDPAPITVAIDLTDVFDVAGVRERLNRAKALAGTKADLNQLTRIISGIKGLTFTARVTDTVNGELRIDFAAPVAPLAPYAKPLILGALEGAGAAMDELESWDVRAEGTSISFRGKVPEGGLRKILSLIVAPVQPVEHGLPEPTAKLEQNPVVVASQRYYHAVTTLIDDLRQQKAKTFNGMATWYDRYAYQIDNLPMLNVDPELLDYGQRVSALFRGLSQSARGVSIQNSTLEQYKAEQQIIAPSSYAWGGYGYGYGYYNNWNNNIQGTVNNYAQIRSVQDRANVTESAGRLQAGRQIDEMTVAIRRRMTEKYKVEF